MEDLRRISQKPAYPEGGTGFRQSDMELPIEWLETQVRCSKLSSATMTLQHRSPLLLRMQEPPSTIKPALARVSKTFRLALSRVKW